MAAQDHSIITPLCWISNPFAVGVRDIQCTFCGQLQAIDTSLQFSIGCPQNCGVQYCSEACQQANKDYHVLCVGALTEDHALFQLKVLALEAGLPHYATITFAAMLAMSTRRGKQLEMTLLAAEKDTLSPLPELLKELVEPTHALLMEAIKDQKSIHHDVSPPTTTEWRNLVQYSNHLFLSGSTRSKFADECDRITASTEGWSSPQGDYLRHLLQVEDSDDEAVLVTSTELMDEPDQFFSPVEWFAFPPATTRTSSCQHSCIPSHKMTARIHHPEIMTLAQTPLHDNNNNNNKAPSETETTDTISLIDNNYTLQDRQELLEERGIVECRCYRCNFERETSDHSIVSYSNLQSLLEHAKAQERYDNAMDIATAMVLQKPQDGQVLLTQTRIAGWQGDFERREVLLRQANEISATGEDSFSPLLEALQEANAYYRRPENEKPKHAGVPWSAAFGDQEEDALAGDVFIGENVLDPSECLQMIEVVEKYQMEQGRDGIWTTSRHYAVPTTDVPVYKIPELLSWFNIQLKETIFPAMEDHFQIQKKNGRLRIFDAFLVKYDAATGQRRLPLHNDQSEYSLTIAMNPLDAYTGGGTYFCDCDQSFKTDVGGVISFRGELLHAGQRITQGTRYIIVCFVYEEKLTHD